VIGKILIVDDSVVVRAVLRKQLEADGHTVVEAGDGEEALRVCPAADPDVILLDVEMPILDGHATLARLKADVETRDIPVVFLTGRVDTADAVAGLRLGAHDYLRKPFEPTELMARVAAALRTRTLQRELRLSMAELEAVSRTDVVTGLDNRRQIEKHLRASISAGRRHARTVGVLMIDVDHFKQVNDTHGHAAGDNVLHEVAARLRTSLRAEDAVGRWGGEEFLTVLTETRAEGNSVVAERMRRLVEATPFTLADGTLVAVTVSIGHASGSGEAELLIAAADGALYLAMANGRNRVEAAAPLVSGPDEENAVTAPAAGSEAPAQ
jgi:two-component system cell cycle response regulator